jgi:hypothetical protein
MNITQTLGDSLTLVANAYQEYWHAVLQSHLSHPAFFVFSNNAIKGERS